MREHGGQPIGVFDSGVGGLTVVRELWRRLPGESVVYFGDTARVPYGSKSPATVCRYASEAARFLLSRGVKMIIVACNTATAHAVERLRAELGVPVVGVIEPGARAAVRATRTGRIAVLGTAGTIASRAYEREIQRLSPSAAVLGQACPLFVPLVEEGWADHAATRLIAREYLEPVRRFGADVVILGCTHYPLLRPIIAECLGDGVKLVDSAAETALDAERVLRDARLLERQARPRPQHRFFVSDSPERFLEVARSFIGDLGGEVELVDVDGYDRAA
ncbi:MAG TPA: glutamate racemase [Longimicrobiales bacterium]